MTATTSLGGRVRRHRGRTVLVFFGGILLAGMTAALGFWTINVVKGAGSFALAEAASLAAPTAPTSSATGSGAITIGWTLPGSQLPGALYRVTRTSPTSTTVCTTPDATVTSCQDSDLVAGTAYSYSIAAVLGTNWQSSAVTTSTTTPSPTYVLTVSSGQYTAGTAASVTKIEVVLGDAVDATYAGAKTIAWSGLTTSPSGQSPTYPSSSATFVAGTATPGSSFTAFASGSNTLTASDSSASGVTGSTTLTVSPASAASFTLAAASTTPTAGAADSLTVTAKDAFGNVATGYAGSKNLTFGGANVIGSNTPTVSNSSGAAVQFGSGTAITFADGVSTVSGANNGVMRLYKAETAAVTVTDGSISNGLGLSVTVSPASAASLALAAATTTPTAGVANNLTITAKDSFGNTALAYTGDKSLTFSGPATIGANTPTVTNKAGVATNVGTATTITFAGGVSTVSGANNGVMRLYKAETTSVTLTDGTIANGTGLSITVSPASAASLSLVATSTTPTAGTANNLTVTARDAFGNTATGYSGDQSLTFAGPAAIGANTPTVSNSSGAAVNFGSATVITFTGGVSTVSGANNGVMRLYKAETASVTLTDGTIANGTGLSITVSPAAMASLKFVTSATGLTASCGTGSIAVGNGGTLTTFFAEIDQFGNPAVHGAVASTVAIVKSNGGGNTPNPTSLTIAANANPAVTSGSTALTLPSGNPADTTYTATLGSMTTSCVVKKN